MSRREGQQELAVGDLAAAAAAACTAAERAPGRPASERGGGGGGDGLPPLLPSPPPRGLDKLSLFLSLFLINIDLGIAVFMSYVAMKDSQDIQSPTELQSSAQGTNEVQSNQPNPMATDGPGGDSGSLSIASNDNRKVSREDIELVQNLIERCLQLYMNKGEVVRTLSTRARIEPGFTTLVWQKLEEENSEFFRAYYIRLKLKRQIILFNHLLQHQYNLMKYPAPPNVPLAPMQNGMHPMPVNNLPMGYPVLQQPMMPAPGQPHIDSMACGLSSGHVVNGIPAAGDLEALENYAGTPFLASDSDILLDSPDQNDIVEYFADAINGPSQSDEEK
uniref:Angiotensin-converting enzyme 2 n=1 Tax=Oryza barthii TaxID=65489 RepID=A0A0D3EL57_9ORYZ